MPHSTNLNSPTNSINATNFRNDKTLTFCIVAGEVSGDQLGAGLISALKKLFPQAQFVGIGGDLMRDQGCQTWYDIADLSYFGVVDVVKNLPSILKTIKQTKQLIAQHQCTIYIGIDNPDFNLRVAKYCKQELKIPTVQYVSPSVWAWRQNRAKTIKAAIDEVLCLLPFEPTFYQGYDVKASYIGHRLANSLKQLLVLDVLAYLQPPLLNGTDVIDSANVTDTITSTNATNPTNPTKETNLAIVNPDILTSLLNITGLTDDVRSLYTTLVESLLKSQELTQHSQSSSLLADSDQAHNCVPTPSDHTHASLDLIKPKFTVEELTNFLTTVKTTNHFHTDIVKTITDLEQIVSVYHQAVMSELAQHQDLWQGIFGSQKNDDSDPNLSSNSDSTTSLNISSQLQAKVNHQPSNLSYIVDFGQKLVTKQLALSSLGLNPQQFYVAVLPGSRSSEISLILEPFLAGLEQAITHEILPTTTHVLIPIAKPKLTTQIREIVSKFKQLQISLVDKNAHQVLLASNLALVASGTATLDTLLCHIPMIVGYKLSAFNYYLAKKLVKLPYVALSNIVQGQEVSKELIQKDLVPDQICTHLQQLLQPHVYSSIRLRFYQQHLALVTDSDTLAAQQIAQLLTACKVID